MGACKLEGLGLGFAGAGVALAPFEPLLSAVGLSEVGVEVADTRDWEVVWEVVLEGVGRVCDWEKDAEEEVVRDGGRRLTEAESEAGVERTCD